MEQKLIRTEFISNKISMQVTSESEIIISDSQPDIKEIIYDCAVPAITFYNVSDGRINFKGIINENFIYISKNSDKAVASAENVVNFEDIMNVEGLDKGSCVMVKAILDRSEFRKINERKVSVRVVITIQADIYASPEVVSVIPEEKDFVQFLSKNSTARNHVYQNKNEFDIHETFSLPSSKGEADEILAKFSNINDVDTKALGGGYRITGKICVDIIYLTGEKKNVESMRFELPFEENIDNDFVTGGMYGKSSVNVLSMKAEVFQDSNGEKRIIDIDAVLNEVTDIFEDEKITYVTDAYSVKYPCKCSFEKIYLPESAGRNKARFNLKAMASRTNGAEIMQIVSADADVVLDSVYAQNGVAAAEGIVNVTVIYIANDDLRPVYSVKTFIPFHQEVEINSLLEKDDILAKAYIDSVGFNILNDSEIEISVSPVIDMEAYRVNRVNVLSDIEKEENAEEINMPAAVIYAVQPSDTLWDISKKYCAVKEDIMDVNGFETEDDIHNVKRILVMRKV